MMLLTKSIRSSLIENNKLQIEHEGELDLYPVVKLFGGSGCTWLLTTLDGDIAFGLCDLGLGCPELGYVSMTEIETQKFPPFGLPAERDMHWEADAPLSAYYKTARDHSRIVA